MKSRHIIYLLSDYLDDLLDDSTKQRVEKHLSTCMHCRTKLQQLQNYQEVVSNLEQSPAPEDIRTKVMEHIESGSRINGKSTMDNAEWTMKKLITVSAAAIIILLILAVPKEIFLPSTVSTDLIGVMQKKGKGPTTVGGVMKKGEKNRGTEEQRSVDLRGDDLTIGSAELGCASVVDWVIVDFRLKRVLELIDEVEGQVVSAELNKTGLTYSHLVVGMSKGNYKDFAEKYNQMGMGEPIPAKAGFSMSNKVLVNLFPIKRRFFVHDYNEDGFDDMVLYYSSGRQENLWYVALNNHMGNFYPALIIDPLMDSLPAAENYDGTKLTFFGDFNGDGLTDHGTKYLSGPLSAQFHILFNIDNQRFSEPTPFTFGNGIMAWQGNYTHYFGDFNADGLCDILTKEGNGDVLGSWYVALNNGRNGFGSTHEVVFGGKKYFSGD